VRRGRGRKGRARSKGISFGRKEKKELPSPLYFLPSTKKRRKGRSQRKRKPWRGGGKKKGSFVFAFYFYFQKLLKKGEKKGKRAMGAGKNSEGGKGKGEEKRASVISNAPQGA